MKFVFALLMITLVSASISLGQQVLETREDAQGRETFVKIDKQNGAGEIEELNTEFHADTMQVHRRVRRTHLVSGEPTREVTEIYDPDGNLLQRREVKWDLNGNMTFGEIKEWIYQPSRQVTKDDVYDPKTSKWKPRPKQPQGKPTTGAGSNEDEGGPGSAEGGIEDGELENLKLDNPQERVSGREPAYPELALKEHKEANVLTNVCISALGTVTAVRIVRGDPLFNNSVRQAISTWRYEPYRIGGKARPVCFDVKYEFKLRNRD